MGWVRYKAYIAMIEDGGETSHDRLEWGKGVCGFLDQIDSQLGCGIRGGLPVQPTLIRCTWPNSGFWEF